MGSSSEYASRRASRPALPLQCASSRSVDPARVLSFPPSLFRIMTACTCDHRAHAVAAYSPILYTTRLTLQQRALGVEEIYQWASESSEDTWNRGPSTSTATPRARRLTARRRRAPMVPDYTHFLLTCYMHI